MMYRVPVVLFLIGCILAGCSFFEPRLDTKFYHADEAIGQKLLKRKNCYVYHKDMILWAEKQIGCDEIGAYRYFTPDKQPYNGPITFTYESSPYNAKFICTGEIKDGYMANDWHFVAPKQFDITGHFTVYPEKEGFAKVDWTGKWIINDYRHNLYYSVGYDTVNQYILLKKIKYNNPGKTGSITVIQSITPDYSINISPFCDHTCSQLRFDDKIEYERETAISCITSSNFNERTFTYVSRELELTYTDNRMIYARYLQQIDSTEYYVTLDYDSLNRITKITTFGDQQEKEFYRNPGKKNSDVFIYHRQDSTLEKLTPKQYLLPRFDSAIQATKNYCTFTR